MRKPNILNDHKFTNRVKKQQNKCVWTYFHKPNHYLYMIDKPFDILPEQIEVVFISIF